MTKQSKLIHLDPVVLKKVNVLAAKDGTTAKPYIEKLIEDHVKTKK